MEQTPKIVVRITDHPITHARFGVQYYPHLGVLLTKDGSKDIQHTIGPETTSAGKDPHNLGNGVSAAMTRFAREQSS